MESIKITKHAAALDLLDQIFAKLSAGSSSADLPIFVAIDTESSDRHLTEVGISTFDPRCLLLPRGSPDILNDHIETYCYAKGGSKNRKRYKPYRLGIPRRFQNTDVKQILSTHLECRNHDGALRKIVLVGHSIRSDLASLKRHSGLDLSRIPHIEAALDVQNIARKVLMTEKPPSLKRLLIALDLDYIGLHNAGHDSRYTLRVLLMLFVRFKQMERTNSNGTVDISLLEDIARCHKILPGETWTPSKRVKVIPGPDIFNQDLDEEEDSGVLALLLE